MSMSDFDMGIEAYLSDSDRLVSKMETDLWEHMRRSQTLKGEVMSTTEEPQKPEKEIELPAQELQIVEWAEHDDGSVTFALHLTPRDLRTFASIGVRQVLIDAVGRG